MTGHAERSPDPALPREFRLICACLSLGPTERRDREVRALAQQNQDWTTVLRTAARHGVAPLLYRILKQQPADVVPAPVLQRLRRRFLENALRSTAMTDELLLLVDDLRRHGIPVLAFKGPVTGALAYGDPGLREMVDLDLFVRREDLPRAADRLRAALPGYDATADAVAEEMRFGYHLQFTRKNPASRIELHWMLKRRVPFDYDGMWERAQRVDLQGTSVATLGPMDQLISLAVHGRDHLWGRLLGISDLARLVERWPAMDWTELLRRADHVRCRTGLIVGLLIAERLLHAEVPASLKPAGASAGLDHLADGLSRRLTRKGRPTAASDLATRMRWSYLLADTWADGAYRALRPSKLDARVVRLPESLTFLYYLVRPVRLLAVALFSGKPASS